MAKITKRTPMSKAPAAPEAPPVPAPAPAAPEAPPVPAPAPAVAVARKRTAQVATFTVAQPLPAVDAVPPGFAFTLAPQYVPPPSARTTDRSRSNRPTGPITPAVYLFTDGSGFGLATEDGQPPVTMVDLANTHVQYASLYAILSHYGQENEDGSPSVATIDEMFAASYPEDDGMPELAEFERAKALPADTRSDADREIIREREVRERRIVQAIHALRKKGLRNRTGAKREDMIQSKGQHYWIHPDQVLIPVVRQVTPPAAPQAPAPPA